MRLPSGSDPTVTERPALLPLDLLDPRLVALCTSALQQAQAPGASVAVVAGDRGYHHAHGVKSVVTNEPVTASTAFHVASCSKAFVSATVASLVAEGLVSWDDPISRYVPEFQLYDPWVTAHASLRDLSANRLGLPRAGLSNFGFDTTISNERVFSGLRHTAPLYPFRSRFTYVNAGHSANAVAVGRITGLGFLATLRQRILQPLGMTSTSGGDAARTELPDQAAWHTFIDDRAVPIDTMVAEQLVGAGGMAVSGADAVQWLRFHLGGGTVDGRVIVPRQALQETHTPQVCARPGLDFHSLFYPGARQAAYALGWAVSDFEGHLMVCHSGNHFGVTAMTLLLPRQGIGIAVYVNATQGAVALAYALAAALLGLPARDWQAYFDGLQPAPPKHGRAGAWAKALVLGAFAGDYHHAADGVLRIERDGDSLSGVRPDGYRMGFRLEPAAQENHFIVRFTAPEWQGGQANDPPLIRFSRDAAGRVTQADWLQAGTTREHRRHV